MIKTALPLILFLALCALLYVGLGNDDPRKIPSVLIYKPSPNFSMPDLYQPELKFEKDQLLGQVSLFNIWATWCRGCRVEHALLLQLKNQGIKIYGLNYKDNRAAAIELLATTGNPYTKIGSDKQGTFAIDWGFYGAPETFVIDKKGQIRDKIIGPLTVALINTRLMPLMAKLAVE